MKTPLPLPAKTRTKPAEVRLKELMDAAEKLFLERGVEATTVSEIVEEAKVAKGTFYHYFDSKTEMLLALRERYMQHFLEELGEAVARVATREPGAWTDQLQAWIAANVRTYIATYRMHDIVFTKHHHLDRANKEKEAILDQLAAILEGGQAAGAWPLEYPRVMALLIYSAVHGATDDAIEAGVRTPVAVADFSLVVAQACLRMLGVSG